MDLADTILLIQLPVPAVAPAKITGNIPLASAALAMAAPVCASCRPVKLCDSLVQNRYGDAALIAHIKALNPAIIGFTATVWNSERITYLAGEIKQHFPGIQIWLGGPEIAADSFLLDTSEPVFDLCVVGEGESAFAALVQGIDPATIPGVFMAGGDPVSLRKAVVLSSLDPIADPFVCGMLKPESDGVMLAEFYRGCRYRCSFCQYQQGRSVEGFAQRSDQRIRETFAWAQEAGIKEMYLLDPSLEQREDFQGFLDLLIACNREPTIPLFAELRAEAIDERCAQRLAEAGVRSVETGLQTVTESALRLAGRRFSRESFTNGIRFMQDNDIAVKADIMAGLPGDSPLGLDATLNYLINLGLDQQTQFFRTQALPGTPLRRNAPKMGVRYETRSPYYVLSTPTWDEANLEAATGYVEEVLGVSYAPLERPALISTQHADAYWAASIPDTPVHYFKGWDLDYSEGRRHLASEHFVDTANTLTLCFHSSTPLRHLPPMLEALDRCVRANPFSSIAVVVASPAGFALDVIDQIDDVLDKNNLSNYAGRMYATTATNRPMRRIFTLLPYSTHRKNMNAWLEDLRQGCEVIWRLDATSPTNALTAVSAGDLYALDYLFLPQLLGSSEPSEEYLVKLIAAATDPARLILDGIRLQWRFESLLP